MNLKLTLAALIIAPLALTACTKKEDAPKTETTAEAPANVEISAEQQAAIDSVDQPDPAAIAIDENVVAEAEAENAAADAEKNGTALAAEPVANAEVAAETATVTDTTAQ